MDTYTCIAIVHVMVHQTTIQDVLSYFFHSLAHSCFSMCCGKPNQSLQGTSRDWLGLKCKEEEKTEHAGMAYMVHVPLILN